MDFRGLLLREREGRGFRKGEGRRGKGME